jgi:hypothetical protein
MINIIYFFSIIGITSGYKFITDNTCNFNNQDSCIKSYYCSWCNNTIVVNNTEEYDLQCIKANVCSKGFNQTSICIYNENYESICYFYDVLLWLLIIFVLICSTYTIAYSILTNVSIENRNNYSGIAFVIFLLINIPACILWSTQSTYFGFYLMTLILISFLAIITSGTQKYIKYRNDSKKGYFVSLN